jgi:hypothetical protein
MRFLLLLVVLVLMTTAALAQTESNSTTGAMTVKTWEKKWFVAIGPVITEAMPGVAATATKFNIYLARIEPLRDHLDLKYFYNGNYNTGAFGGSDILTAGIGFNALIGDRLKNSTPFWSVDVGYGGGNRNTNAGPVLALGVGYQFYRLTNYTVVATLRHQRTITSSVSQAIANYPGVTQVSLGIMF